MEPWEFIKTLADPEAIIQYGGLTLLLIVLFLENGAPIGFMLPGDSLIFTAGLLNSTGYLHQPAALVLVSMFLAGAAGYHFGWWTGHKAGKAIRKRPDTFWFRRKHLAVAESFYERYGGKMFLIARFLPVVRTFAPILAGAVGVPRLRFLGLNLLGMVLWLAAFFPLGWWAGHSFPWIRDYLGWVVVLLLVSTSVPVVLRYRDSRRNGAARGKNAVDRNP